VWNRVQVARFFFFPFVNFRRQIPSTYPKAVGIWNRTMQDADVMGAFPVVSAEPGSSALDDFDAIVRAHQQHVFRVLASLVRDGDTADTLTQECFLRAYKNRGSFRGNASVRTWLLTIAVNLARDHARSRRMNFWKRLFQQGEDASLLAEALPDRRPAVDTALIARQELGTVWASLEQLPDRQRTVFVLRFVDDLSLEQIATTMGTTVGTVKTHLFRAVASLRQITGRSR
jgi:RNA polymerase sigma-70 factor (ECF subfamily)